MRMHLLFIALLAFSFTISAQNSTGTKKMTQEVFETVFAAENFDQGAAYFASEVKVQFPGGQERTLDQFLSWRKWQSERIKNEYSNPKILADGNEAVLFALWTGTVQAETEGLAMGAVSKVPAVIRYIWENDKIVRLEMYWDNDKVNTDLASDDD